MLLRLARFFSSMLSQFLKKLVALQLAGAGAAAVVCVIQFFSGAAWASMSVPYILLVFAAQLMFMVLITTVLVLLLTYVSFRYAAKRRRDTMEEQTGDD